MSIKEILNKPYPILLNRWKTTIFVSVFISFFLLVFQPFGLQNAQINNKTIVLFGYGVVTFLLLLINLFLLPSVFKNTFNEEKWTVWKQVIYLTCIVVTISIGNYGYSILFSIFQWIGYKGFLIFLFFTLPIAVIPITIITFITQNVYLKKNLLLSDRINVGLAIQPSEKKNNITITFYSGTQKYHFLLDTIIFLESDGNYVNINSLENGQIKTKLVRNTLKNICSGISAKELFKCHRAFVINIQYIEKVEGNSHGISLTLKHVEKQIPVSRNYTKDITELLSNTKM